MQREFHRSIIMALSDIYFGNKKLYENYSLDGQYCFNEQYSLYPYLTTGFGEFMWQKDE
ncbi:MAG: hypothetical protein QNK36_05530 [Colwellia sp.]|nr:hypothetical protein [Colwellia sp.]